MGKLSFKALESRKYATLPRRRSRKERGLDAANTNVPNAESLKRGRRSAMEDIFADYTADFGKGEGGR